MHIVRMQARRDFLTAACSGNYRSNKFCIVQCFYNTDIVGLEIATVGFTASKKSIGNAVSRNLAKRRMRAAVFPILKTCALPGVSYVLIAKKVILESVFQDFKKILFCDIALLNRLLSNE